MVALISSSNRTDNDDNKNKHLVVCLCNQVEFTPELMEIVSEIRPWNYQVPTLITRGFVVRIALFVFESEFSLVE